MTRNDDSAKSCALKTVNRRAAESGGAYSQLGNAMLQDSSISDEARGVLCRALSRPLDWRFSMRQVGNAGKGYRICRELILAGYVRRTRERKADGTLGRIEFEFTDVPNTFEPLGQNRQVVVTNHLIKNHSVVQPRVEFEAPTNKEVSPQRKIEKKNSQSALTEKGLGEGEDEERLPFSQFTLTRIEGLGIPANWLIGRYLEKTAGKLIKKPDAYLFQMAQDEFSKRHGLNVAMVRQELKAQKDRAFAAADIISNVTASMKATASPSLRASGIVVGGRR